MPTDAPAPPAQRAATTPPMALPIDRARITVRQVAPWTGSDGAMIPAVTAVLGRHSAYFGLCCGGLGALLAKRRCALETACDLHGGLVLLAVVIASPRWFELYDRCDRTQPSQPLFEAAREILTRPHPVPVSPFDVTDDDLDVAWAYAVVWWLGMGGHAGSGVDTKAGRQDKPAVMSLRATPGGGTGASRFKSFTGSLDGLHRRLQHVHVRVDDCFRLLSLHAEQPSVPDRVGHAVYIDPPFIAEGGMYTIPWTAHDPASTPLFKTEDDFDRLAMLLHQRVRCRIVVRHYRHERLDALFPRETWSRVWLPNTKRQMGHEAGGEDTRSGKTDALYVKNIRESELAQVPAPYEVEPADDIEGWWRELGSEEGEG